MSNGRAAVPSGADGGAVLGAADAVPAEEPETGDEEEDCAVDVSDCAGAGLAHPVSKTAPSETTETIAGYFTNFPYLRDGQLA
jgi:hypothetical protein